MIAQDKDNNLAIINVKENIEKLTFQKKLPGLRSFQSILKFKNSSNFKKHSFIIAR